MTPLSPTDGMAELHRALQRVATAERPWARCDAYLHAGRCYRTQQALPSAQAMFEQALRWSWVSGSVDLSVDTLCELGDNAAAQAEALDAERTAASGELRDQARDHALDAARLAAQATDARWEVTSLLRISDLLDRLGDHEAAAGLQLRALRTQTGRARQALAESASVRGTAH